MRDVESFISPLIESQFPSFYREEGQNFVAFVKAYYEWLEENHQLIAFEDPTIVSVGDSINQKGVTGTVVSLEGNNALVKVDGFNTFHTSAQSLSTDHIVGANGNSHVTTVDSVNPTYLARNLFQIRDIDTTLDDFILHFKEKYLKNIQFDIATNKQLLVKNSFDLYRSKGTERGIDLFFKLVYGINAEVYYPGDDLLRPSDGVWTKPRYLEVTDTKRCIDYVGRQITGSLSGATAFVEKYIKRRVTGSVVGILYVSNISGTFLVDEPLKVNHTNITPDAPRVVGSLTEVTVTTGSKLFSVGDIVSFTSTKGMNGLARVASIADKSGVVDFLFEDGGFGYTTNADVIVSEKVLSVQNVVTTNTQYFKLFETLYQPQANIVFNSANADFTNSALIYTYYANNVRRGLGRVIANSQDAGAPNGEMYITILSGNFPAGANIYTTSNTKVANVVTYTDATATAQIMGWADHANLSITGATSTFQANIEVYQSNSSTEWANGTVQSSTPVGSIYELEISNINGAFHAGDTLKIRNSSTTGTVDNISIDIGVYNITGAFVNTDSVYCYGGSNRTNVAIADVSTGFNAGFQVGTIGEVESIFIDVDMLSANNGNNTSANAYLDTNRKNLGVASITGFANNDYVYQDTDVIALNPLTSVNNSTGFITLPNANTHYIPGDTVKYRVSTGNTAINELENNQLYYVYDSNTTGIFISRRYDDAVYNTANFPVFANNRVSETGHFISKLVWGQVVNTSVGTIVTKSSYNEFRQTGGSPTTSVYANSNLILYTNTLVNTSISTVAVGNQVNVANQSWMSMPIMSYAYGFNKNPWGNIRDIIYSCLTFVKLDLGVIGSITAIDPGTNYNIDPFVLINQPYISGFDRHDYIFTIENASGTFREGEKIIQTSIGLTYNTLTVANTQNFVEGERVYWGTSKKLPTAAATITDVFSGTSMRVNNITGTISNTTVRSYTTSANTLVSNNVVSTQFASAKGIVKAGSNTSTLYVKRINFENTFRPTYQIQGQTSGATANIVAVVEDTFNTRQIGLNASVTANVVTANGSVATLQVTDSGFGYANSSYIKYVSEDGQRVGDAIAITGGLGTGSGYYKSSKGFLSDNKYLIDSDYYQEYSYDIISKMPFDKYSEMFKKVMHTAGTRVFGSVVLVETGDVALDVNETEITQTTE